LLLATDDRSDLVGLKFPSRKTLDFSVIESTTAGAGLLQPAMNRIPGNSFDSSDRRLVQAFDTQSSNSIKRGATVLESIIRCATGRGERLPTSLALVATTLSPSSFVKTMANDGAHVVFPGVLVGTAETLHRW
jgi:hypothetical protein